MTDLTQLNTSDAVVHFETAPCSNNTHIGIATLNVPKALNALNLEIIALLSEQLQKWEQDTSIVLVILKGSGEKAFCAGGDIVSLHTAMKAGEGERFGTEFFTKEYQLDYAIASYNKPIVVWGDGIVMGGGMGLMAGASHRVVTERSKLAMPEITIGLYPDVGASYFLQKSPEHVGLFLGLTGALMSADDAKFAKFADHALDSAQYDDLLKSLCEQSWGQVSSLNHDKLTQLLKKYENNAKTPEKGGLRRHLNDIQRLGEYASLAEKVDYILSIQSEDKWLNKAQKTLQNGCPLSAHLVHQQLERAKGLSLKACFKMELGMSVTCCIVGEFQEGIRALLVDKDMQPKWQYPTLSSVTEPVIEQFFESKWDSHPLDSM